MSDVDRVQQRLDDMTDTAWYALLNNEGGRAVVWSILERCHIFQSTYTGNSASTFHEGERNIGLHILNNRILPHGPKHFTQMMEEAQARREEIEAAYEREEQEKKS